MLFITVSLVSMILFTPMHAVSCRSYFCLACSSRVNIEAPVFYSRIMSLWTVLQLELHSLQHPTAMWDSQSINTSLLQVMIYSKREQIFIPNLTDLTLQIILVTWCASMNVGLKRPIAWNNSRNETSWRFHLHCGIEETGCPDCIYIVCHQVLCQLLEHGTSSMGKHLMAIAHIAKLNELTELEVSELTSTTVDETALVILKRQCSSGITFVTLQYKFIFDSLMLLIVTQLTDTMLFTGSKGLPNFRISPRYLKSLPYVSICFCSHSLEHYIKLRATSVI